MRGDASYVEFIRRAKQPELPVILLEDFAALVGLVFALFGVGLSLLTQNLWFDVVGTALIGLLLVAVAIVLAIETKSLLLGESASVEAEDRIAEALRATGGIDRIIHLKTLHLGPDELLVAAKVGVHRDATATEIADRDRRGRGGHPDRRADRPGDLPRARHLPRLTRRG